MKIFEQYPETFDLAFYYIKQIVTDENNMRMYQKGDMISFIFDNMTLDQKQEIVSSILNEETDDGTLECYLPTLKLIAQFLIDPSKCIKYLKNNFIENVWKDYKLTFKEIFLEAFFLFSNKCPLPHEITENTPSKDYRFHDFVNDYDEMTYDEDCMLSGVYRCDDPMNLAFNGG